MKQSMQTQSTLSHSSEPVMVAETSAPPLELDADQQRAGAYSLLAAVLRQSVNQEMCQHLAGFASLDSDADDIAIALNMLGMAAAGSDPQQIDDEFHSLFIGLGRGELVPYASWYQTGFLMERPLGDLRDDLKALGFERDENVHEPEDHIAALCEVMSMLISDGATQAAQVNFYNRHLADWVERFFTDLVNAKTATFYRSVGRLGLAFFDFERRYLAMQV